MCFRLVERNSTICPSYSFFILLPLGSRQHGDFRRFQCLRKNFCPLLHFQTVASSVQLHCQTSTPLVLEALVPCAGLPQLSFLENAVPAWSQAASGVNLIVGHVHGVALVCFIIICYTGLRVCSLSSYSACTSALSCFGL